MGPMMTGVPEEMTTEVEGEAWMMDHVVARTPNPGSLWGDLVGLPHHQLTVAKVTYQKLLPLTHYSLLFTSLVELFG